MSVKIRLARFGAKKRPCYRVVVSDSRSPRDGRFIEQVGRYNPTLPQGSTGRFVVDFERLKYWIGVGATPTSVIKRLVHATRQL
ncbi:30S ribosomal protein S16 [Candidatus Cyrtobacter comes]|uniref:30S ribosomal protein S16 n=1 Tax=Candidatus Cyrtobacter comes TaxID=675776 RepID=UPI002ACD7928|nr:30S ribosomal protein S16 [Candidatus Cyrtobacter comes]